LIKRITYFLGLLAFWAQPFSVRATEDITTIYEKAQKSDKDNPDSALFYYSYVVRNEEAAKKQPEIIGKSYRRLALITSQTDIDKAMAYCKKCHSHFSAA
jgi:hypothetical protein